MPEKSLFVSVAHIFTQVTMLAVVEMTHYSHLLLALFSSVAAAVVVLSTSSRRNNSAQFYSQAGPVRARFSFGKEFQ
jgi:hypothetical protein